MVGVKIIGVIKSDEKLSEDNRVHLLDAFTQCGISEVKIEERVKKFYDPDNADLINRHIRHILHDELLEYTTEEKAWGKADGILARIFVETQPYLVVDTQAYLDEEVISWMT